MAKQSAEKQIAYFWTSIQPTLGQQGLFDAYAENFRQYFFDFAQKNIEFSHDFYRSNAVGILALRQRKMQFEADRLKEQLRLLTDLYASLNPAQKVIANRIWSP
jgi:hypothetical protein